MLSIGKKYNYLTILEKTNIKTKNGDYKYKCLCDCGKITFIIGSNIKRGNTKSCGCYQRKNRGKISKGYRNKNKRIYNIYQNIKQRCYDKNSINYKNYGEREIKMCDEWKNDYVNFYNWAINNGYDDNLSIDRIDVNGNYEPSNCRWATRIEQANNTRKNRLITYNNKTQTLAEWAKELGFSQQKLKYRLDNWCLNRAFDK